MSSPTQQRHHYPMVALPTLPQGLGDLSNRLKKTNELLSFTKYDLDAQYVEQRCLSVQERMRVMDRFYMHSPHPEEECSLLNLPSNRLHLHSLKDVLYLSGGLVGVRFDAVDFRTASELLSGLSQLWTEIDRAFKAMSNRERKINVSNIQASAEAEEIESALRFHDSCDRYLVKVKELQALIRRKQGEIDLNEAGMRELPKIDADPESRIGSQFPLWFTVLKEKYITHLTTFKESSDLPKFTLGKFAVFLSSCVHGPITCTPDEIQALNELKDASVDNISIFKPEVHVTSNNMNDTQRKYWAHRFFNFLKSVPELKTTVKDERAVESMSIW